MALPEYVIPIASILVPIAMLFVVRGLDKGEKRRSQLEGSITDIHRFVETNKGLIAKIVEDVANLDERIRRAENELSRVIGRLNGKHI